MSSQVSHQTNEHYNFNESQSTVSSNSSQLRCGGLPCIKCGACRDWYQRRNSDDIVKRHGASCDRAHMFLHDLVRRPEYYDTDYYPAHNLMCMCKDNC